MGDALFGSPPETTTTTQSPLFPPLYNWATGAGNSYLPGAALGRLPTYLGSIDPGISPSSQAAIQFGQGRFGSPANSLMAQSAQGLSGLMGAPHAGQNYMNPIPGQGGFGPSPMSQGFGPPGGGQMPSGPQFAPQGANNSSSLMQSLMGLFNQGNRGSVPGMAATPQAMSPTASLMGRPQGGIGRFSGATQDNLLDMRHGLRNVNASRAERGLGGLSPEAFSSQLGAGAWGGAGGLGRLAGQWRGSQGIPERQPPAGGGKATSLPGTVNTLGSMTPGQGGRYGGINPGGGRGAPQMLGGPQAQGNIPGFRPGFDPRTASELKMPGTFDPPVIGGQPGESGRYGGINPGGEAPSPWGAPVSQQGGKTMQLPYSIAGGGWNPGQGGRYGGINPGGRTPQLGGPMPTPQRGAPQMMGAPQQQMVPELLGTHEQRGGPQMMGPPTPSPGGGPAFPPGMDWQFPESFGANAIMDPFRSGLHNPLYGQSPQQNYFDPGSTRQGAIGPSSVYDVYQASTVPMQDTLKRTMEETMAQTGLTGNRFSTAVPNIMAREVGEQTNQLNSQFMDMLYNQGQSDLNRSLQAAQSQAGAYGADVGRQFQGRDADLNRMLQAAQLGGGLGSQWDAMRGNQARDLFDMGRWETDRADRIAAMPYQDYLQGRQGYIPQIMSLLSGVGNPSSQPPLTSSTGGGSGFADYAVPIITAMIMASSKDTKSDVRRLKPTAAEKRLGLSPVSFHYKAEKPPRRRGYIAEEVDRVLPESVVRYPNGKIYGLDYGAIARSTSRVT